MHPGCICRRLRKGPKQIMTTERTQKISDKVEKVLKAKALHLGELQEEIEEMQGRDGLSRMDDALMKKLTVNNDVMVVNIDDAYLFGDTVYDLESGRYEDDFVLQSPKLHAAELAERARIHEEAAAAFRRYGVSMVTVEKESEIVEKIIELFRRHRDEDFG